MIRRSRLLGGGTSPLSATTYHNPNSESRLVEGPCVPVPAILWGLSSREPPPLVARPS